MRVRLVIAAFVVLLASAWPSTATAEYTEHRLAPVASVFAMQPVTVTCATPQEDWLLYDAWGYVFLYAPVIHTSPYLCEAAANVNDPSIGASRKAIAVLVLIHEAFHLRKQWSARGDEAKVQCAAIRHFRVGAQLLGASPELATALRPYALSFHWQLAARFPEYNLDSCKVPRP